MTCNMGSLERTMRVLIGLALVLAALFYVASIPMSVVVYMLAAIPLITGIVGYCPAWAVFGIDTRGTGEGGTCRPRGAIGNAAAPTNPH